MRRTLIAPFSLLFLLSAAARGQETQAALLQNVLDAFEELESDVVLLSDGDLTRGRSQSLLAKLDAAEARYVGGQGCVSAQVLEAFLYETRRSPPRQVMLDLHHRALLLLDTLLASLPEGQDCRVSPPDAGCLEDAPWPELVAHALTADPETPHEGDEALLTLEVVNRGGEAASGVAVSFAENGEEFGTELVSIEGCGRAVVRRTWPGTDRSASLLEARIDPAGTLQEGTKSNNLASLTLGVLFETVRPWELPDLIIEGLDLAPSRAVAGDAVALTAQLTHRASEVAESTSVLRDITVRFTVDGVEVDVVEIGEVSPDETIAVRGEWISSEPGRHYVSASAELAPGDAESDPINNTYSDVIHVGGEASPLPDLFVDVLSLDPEAPAAGDTLTVRATIRNIGWAPAENVPLELHSDVRDGVATAPTPRFDDVLLPETLFHTATIPWIGPGDSVQIEAALPLRTATPRTVWLHVDPSDLVPKTEAPDVFARRVDLPSTLPLCFTDQTSWSSVGPSALTNGWSGRVDDIVIDPNDTSVIYVGTPTGGIWKTTNGGASWSPRTDFMPSLDISGMTMDPTDADVLYAGSGAGVYKSIDGGATWHVFTDTSVGTRFETLLVRYTASDRFELYAAGDKGVWLHEGSNKFATQASAGAWSRIKTGNVTSFVEHPTDPAKFYVGLYKDGVYRSLGGSPPIGDGSWETLSDGTTGLPKGVSGSARVALAKSSPNVLYAGVKVSGSFELYRSTNAGDSWEKRFSMPGGYKLVKPTVALDAAYWESWYNDYLFVDPTSPSTIFMGHVQAYRSDNGGTTFQRIRGLHDDQHGYLLEPGNPSTIYLSGDGGIFRCTSKGASCTAINNDLRTMMYYDVAVSDDRADVVVGGTQDNGTIATLGALDWTLIRGGDGRYVGLLSGDADSVFSQHQYLGETAKAEGWLASFSAKWKSAPGLPAVSSFKGDPFFIPHPADGDVVLTAGPEAFQHEDAGSDWTSCPTCPGWTGIGPDKSLHPQAKGHVKRVAIDPTSNTLYVGMTSGQIWTSTSGGASWALIFTHPSSAGSTGLAVDPSNPSKLWGAFGGKGKTHGPNRVWLLERIPSDVFPPVDFWKATNVTANLPAELALGDGWRMSNMIAPDPFRGNTVYVATTKGVYRGAGVVNDTGSLEWLWRPFNCGLPHVRVTDLEIHPITKKLYGATFGRGLWVNPLIAPIP